MSQLTITRQTQRVYHFVEDLQGMNHLPLQMIQIPSGSFVMGSPASEIDREEQESPQHMVAVASFSMGHYPITKAQWNFVASLDKEQKNIMAQDITGQENYPVTDVSWYDAMEFCARLSRHTKRNYRLPSEAEWEYACRAVTVTDDENLTIEEWNTQYNKPFHFGETISAELANYDGNYTYERGESGEYRGDTTPVDFFGVANNFGLSDMHGNVWEWCADPWHDGYDGAPNDSRVWDEDGNNNCYQNILENLAELLNDKRERLLRGGSWDCYPWYCRSACRGLDNPDGGDFGDGFRVVVSGARTL